MKKSVMFALMSILLCAVLIAGCGDEPTAQQKQADMDKAFTVLGEQLTRFSKMSPKMEKIADDYTNKKINAAQIKQQFDSMSTEYGDIAAKIKGIAVPQWLSSEDKAKFEDLKKQYVEANEAMKSFLTLYIKIVVDDKGTKEDVEKLKEYNAIKIDRAKKGAAIFAYFEKGTWK